MKGLRGNDVGRWANTFLDTLERVELDALAA
jgi:hypothetical protein